MEQNKKALSAKEARELASNPDLALNRIYKLIKEAAKEGFLASVISINFYIIEGRLKTIHSSLFPLQKLIRNCHMFFT